MEKKVKTKKFKKILEKGKVHFVYTKKDGTLREATGTLKYEFIPEDMWPKMDFSEVKDPPKDPINLRYFDLDKNAWRSISSDTREVKVL